MRTKHNSFELCVQISIHAAVHCNHHGRPKDGHKPSSVCSALDLVVPFLVSIVMVVLVMIAVPDSKILFPPKGCNRAKFLMPPPS